MAFNRFPHPGPGPGIPGVSFHMGPPFYPVPPTFPIMGGPPPPVHPAWQGNPMMPVRPDMGPGNPNMSMPPSDMGYWRGSDRPPVRDFNPDNRGPQERRPDVDRGSPPRQAMSVDFIHAEREEFSDGRRVILVSRDKRHSPDRDRRDRSSSRDRGSDGPSGSKRMRYENDARYDISDRYDDRERRERDRAGDYRRGEDERRYDDTSRKGGSEGLRFDTQGQPVRLSEDMYDRDGSRRSPSPRRDDRNGHYRSPNRRSPDRRSPGWRSPRRSPGGRSPDRRSPGGRSPDRRSPGRRSPDRRSPGRRSPDRRSQGRRSPNRRSSSWRSPARSPTRRASDRRSPGRRSPGRRSPGRSSSRRSPEHRSSDRYSPGRRSPGRRSPGRRSSDRRSPGRKSSDRRSPGRKSSDRISPGRRSPDRRSPVRKSPGRRSPGRRSPGRRSPGRRSPGRKSPDRGSPGHGYWRGDSRLSPDRHRDGNLNRRSRSPDMSNRDPADSYRRSPDRHRGDEIDRNRQSPVSSRRVIMVPEYSKMSPNAERRTDSSRKIIKTDETWKCPKCRFNNYMTRKECYKCQFSRGESNIMTIAYPPQAAQPNNSPEEIMKRIHISNLDQHTTAEDLAHYFSRWGRVVYSNIVLNTATKRPKGYGFVSFSKASEATNAMANYHTIRGRAVIVNPLKYSEKIESRLEVLYDEISSDEEDHEPEDNRSRYMCKVKLCGFQGFFHEFRHHWKEIHTSHGRYLVCPVCDTGCPDRTGMRRHLMFAHGVTDEGGAMDNILANVNMEERRNPYFVDPGNVEKEGKHEILDGGEPINPFKVFKCTEAGCPFAASANPLLQHWNAKHLNTTSSLSCPVCSVKFIRKGLLIEHFRIGHGISAPNDDKNLPVGAEEISSDEDEDEFDAANYRFMCKVTGCKFQGPKSSFRRHWDERHELMEKYLACPYCGIGCRDHSEVRYHLITVHKVKDDDPILDDALIRSFTRERINPDYLDPGDVEPEDKFEVPVARSKQSASKGASMSTSAMSRKRTDPSKKDSTKTSDGNQKIKSVMKSVTTQTTATKEQTTSASSVGSLPSFEMMKYNSNNTDSIKKFLAWTDSLMEKLEEAHHEARKKLNILEEAKQEKKQKKESNDKKEEVKKTRKEESAPKKTETKKPSEKKTETKKSDSKKSESKSKETSKRKAEPQPIRPVETRGRNSSRLKERYRR